MIDCIVLYQASGMALHSTNINEVYPTSKHLARQLTSRYRSSVDYAPACSGGWLLPELLARSQLQASHQLSPAPLRTPHPSKPHLHTEITPWHHERRPRKRLRPTRLRTWFCTTSVRHSPSSKPQQHSPTTMLNMLQVNRTVRTRQSMSLRTCTTRSPNVRNLQYAVRRPVTDRS